MKINNVFWKLDLGLGTCGSRTVSRYLSTGFPAKDE